MLRLVKGAYWDTEIKHAQVEGQADYPVFTQKENTDLSYLVCARKMLDNLQAFYAQFATHNARTVASIMAFVDEQPKVNKTSFEFQCLHGMGEALYEKVVSELNYQCRIYAPVGEHKRLLAYLVRRLLENGANTSFVNLLAKKDQDIDNYRQSRDHGAWAPGPPAFRDTASCGFVRILGEKTPAAPILRTAYGWMNITLSWHPCVIVNGRLRHYWAAI